MLDEVAALFPAPYIHIGGDEVPKQQWAQSASSQQRMHDEKLADVDALQSWFVQRIQHDLEARGKTLVGWDEILEGGADRNAVVEMWRGDAEAAKALANGNRLIVAGPFYLDTPIDELTTQDIYRINPFASPAFAGHENQVLGAEAPLWSEYVTPRNLEAMLYPRVIALAERLWNPDAHDYPDFQRRLRAQYPWLDAQHIAYGPEDRDLVDYKLDYNPHPPPLAPARRARLRRHRAALHHGRQRTDRPVARLRRRAGPLHRRDAQDHALPPRRALPDQPHVPDGRQPGAGQTGHLPHRARRRTTPAPPRNSSTASSAATTTTTTACGSAGAAPTSPPPSTCSPPNRSTASRCASCSRAVHGPCCPSRVTFAVSDDGKTWRTLQSTPIDVQPMDLRVMVRTVRFDAATPVTARYLRVTAQNYGLLPVGHEGAGKPAFLFTDEILVQ